MGAAADIKPLGPGQQLVVVLTVTGKVTPAQAEKWNQKIKELGQLGINIQSVTIKPEPRPGRKRAR
jgi:hypothetical protein